MVFIYVPPRKNVFFLCLVHIPGHYSFCLANNTLGTSAAVNKRKNREADLMVAEKCYCTEKQIRYSPTYLIWFCKYSQDSHMDSTSLSFSIAMTTLESTNRCHELFVSVRQEISSLFRFWHVFERETERPLTLIQMCFNTSRQTH